MVLSNEQMMVRAVLLRGAAAVKRGWCRNYAGKRVAHHPLLPDAFVRMDMVQVMAAEEEPFAVCALGGIARGMKQLGLSRVTGFNPAKRELEEALYVMQGGATNVVEAFNDHVAKGPEDVLTLYRRAVRRMVR